MTVLNLATVRLRWCGPWTGPPMVHKLRGAIAARIDDPLFHQHEDGKTLYRYPRIQYRWDREGPLLAGIGPGTEALLELPWSGLELTMGDRTVTVLEAQCELTRHVLAASDDLIRYRFHTPWLSLNQARYRDFGDMSGERQDYELDRLARAGLLVMLRELGFEFPGRLYAAFHHHRRQPCQHKGTTLLGFRGELAANVDLPSHLAIGHAVSHGFGWLLRREPDRGTNREGTGNER